MRKEGTDDHLKDEQTMRLLDEDDRFVIVGIKIEKRRLPEGFLRQLLRARKGQE